MEKKIKKLFALGPPGSYLDGLAASMELDIPIMYGDDFPSMIAQTEASPETATLLPIKNTLNGTIYDVVGAFQGGKLMVMTAAKLDVVSNIMGIGTLDEAVSIGGKDVALRQITRFMPHLLRLQMPSTSAAGQYIQETKDRTVLAVGAKAQAEIYGLNVLAEGVQDTDGLNRTTVLMVRGRNGWRFDPYSVDTSSYLDGTMIMRVEDSDRSGSLHRALGEIADRDINLTNIESLNIRGTEISEFFITFSGLGTAIADLATSRQAAAHMRLDILGTYDSPITYGS